VSGPAFVSDAVHVAFAPTRVIGGAVVIVSCTSLFGGAGGFHVTVASFEVIWNRITVAWTWSVPVSELE
jgi:hypothetical protein